MSGEGCLECEPPQEDSLISVFLAIWNRLAPVLFVGFLLALYAVHFRGRYSAILDAVVFLGLIALLGNALYRRGRDAIEGVSDHSPLRRLARVAGVEAKPTPWTKISEWSIKSEREGLYRIRCTSTDSGIIGGALDASVQMTDQQARVLGHRLADWNDGAASLMHGERSAESVKSDPVGKMIRDA